MSGCGLDYKTFVVSIYKCHHIEPTLTKQKFVIIELTLKLLAEICAFCKYTNNLLFRTKQANFF